MSVSKQKRIAELETLAAEEGIALPWPAEVIARIEESGMYVDLATGRLGSEEERFSLTVWGEVMIVLDGSEED